MPQFADYHRTVVGFHGTTRELAERIVTTGAFTPSQNDDDWLGHGIYFWEYAPLYAYQWAIRRHARHSEIAVIGAMIRLGHCFDLLDPENADQLVKTKDLLVKTLRHDHIRIPRNYNARKYLDCAVFQNFYQVQQDQGVAVDTARAVYVPTGGNKRLWERSWLHRETHVQLCVRNADNILGVWIAKPVDRDSA